MFSALLVLCIAMMAVLFEDHCHARDRIQINPMFGLLAGTAYYVLLPCAVVSYFQNELSTITVYDSYFTIANATAVLALTFVLLIALWCGARLARDRVRTSGKFRLTITYRRRLLVPNMPRMLLFSAFAALLILAYSIRGFLFVGYDDSALGSDIVWSARGAMSSLYSVIYVAMFAIMTDSKERVKRVFLRGELVAFFCASILLLSLGARLYVAMAVVSWLSMRSVQQDGIRAKNLLLFFAGVAALFGTVGVLRSTSIDDLKSILLNVALEPLLTSISLFTLLTDNSLILFGKPYLFPIDFQAVLPSFLFPAKAGLFDRLADYGYAFDAPVGGYHLYFSLLINFGVIGAVVATLLCGYGLGRLSRPRRKPSRFATLVSVYLAGALMFTVFRDPFFISIVKNVFVMGIIVPALLTKLRLGRSGGRVAKLETPPLAPLPP